ncbi:hypothetical protein T484DRAFT_1978025 [Baffinella frigidus]|nr:hypothetical protein T484DRAFT_1978025 [Cryptophyta sp. CCMP2293]
MVLRSVPSGTMAPRVIERGVCYYQDVVTHYHYGYCYQRYSDRYYHQPFCRVSS